MEIASDIVSTVAGVGYVSMEVSCVVGCFIVKNTVAALSIIFKVATTFFRILGVINEDYCIFISDVFSTLYHICHTLPQIVESTYYVSIYLCSVLWSCVSMMGACVIGCLTGVYNVFYYCLASIINMYVLFRNTSFFFGSTVWDAVMGVPGFICYIVYLCLQEVIEWIRPLIHLLYRCLLQPIFEPHLFFSNLYQTLKYSVLEFPFKPLCGLSMAIFIGFIVLKKRHSLLTFAYETWFIVTTQSQQVLVSAWQTFEGYVLWLLTNQRRDWQRVPLYDRFNDNIDEERFLNDAETDSIDSDTSEPAPQLTSRKKGNKDQENQGDNEDLDVRLCVVCQDKSRCMLTLPCRHVCLCSACCTAVRAHQGLCPLCRQEISFSGKVYL